MESHSDQLGPVPKPEAIHLFAKEIEAAFAAIWSAFEVPEQLTVNVSTLGVPEPGLEDSGAKLVFTLRRLQALYYLSQPGVATTGDVLIGLIAEVDRACWEMCQSLTNPDALATLEIFVNRAAEVYQVLIATLENDPMQPLV